VKPSSGRFPQQVPAGPGDQHEVRSPVDGMLLRTLALASEAQIARRIKEFVAVHPPLSAPAALAFLKRLGTELQARRGELIAATVQETGFILRDSEETVDGAIEFLATFARYVGERDVRGERILHSYLHASSREMSIEHRPYSCVAALVPQNASLTLAVTITAAGVYAGSRVVVRPSLQCASTTLLLQEALSACGASAAPILLVDSKASDFLAACFASDDVSLVHFIGGNNHAESVYLGAFHARKTCLIDGQGNGMLYVDGTFPLEEAARLITAGATRFNGATCTSINGVLVAAEAYPALRSRLVESFRALRIGHPADPRTQIGPLFSAQQAERLAQTLKGASKHLCGGSVSGGYFTPTIVEGVERDSELVRAGVYGPALWLQPVEDSEIFHWIRGNAFPLSDTILSYRDELVRTFAARSQAARITVNDDPSVESMFEPWGGYPPSGWNPVSVWTDKYRQAFQLDGRPSALAADRIGA
jgi:acyl-CoA reductase-like NAD-dependent aldehyde dehydrogenase